MAKAIQMTQTLNAAPATVYFALTNGFRLLEWLANDSRVAAQPDGRLYLWWQDGYYAAGRFTELVENERVAFSWQGADEPVVTQVTIELVAADDDTTQLTLTHTGYGDATEAQAQVADRWEAGLNNLKATLEEGTDQRIAQRPMLGIGGGSTLTEEQAASLGTPVSTGYHVSLVIDGFSAAEAGMQANDVIVGINALEVVDGPSLLAATGQHSVGETVAVSVYRGSEKLSLDVMLSAQPTPPVAATPAELATHVETAYAAVLDDLQALFDGVSDAAASAKPAADEWSAKEVLAHLIITERWAHHFIGLVVAGQPTGGGFNENGVHAAVAATYDSVPALIGELRNAMKTSILALQQLPDAFYSTRRMSVSNLATTFTLGLPFHTRNHFPQIQAATGAGGQSKHGR